MDSAENATGDYYADEPTAPYEAVYILIFIFGLSSNVITLCAIWRVPRMHTVTCFYLANLAMADLLFLLLYLPLEFSMLYTITWKLGEFVCIFAEYLRFVSLFATVWTLAVLSISKFYSVVGQFKYNILYNVNEAPRRIIVWIWLFCLVAAYPIVFINDHVEVSGSSSLNPVEKSEYYCYPQWSSVWQLFAFTFYIFMMVVFVPFFIMIYSYCRISSVLRLFEKGHNGTTPNGITDTQFNDCDTESNGNRDNQPIMADREIQRQESRLLLTISILFALCYFPAFVSYAFLSYGIVWLDAIHLVYFLHYLSCSYCFWKPIFYYFLSDLFREGYKEIFRSILGRVYNVSFQRFY